MLAWLVGFWGWSSLLSSRSTACMFSSGRHRRWSPGRCHHQHQTSFISFLFTCLFLLLLHLCCCMWMICVVQARSDLPRLCRHSRGSLPGGRGSLGIKGGLPFWYFGLVLLNPSHRIRPDQHQHQQQQHNHHQSPFDTIIGIFFSSIMIIITIIISPRQFSSDGCWTYSSACPRSAATLSTSSSSPRISCR